jgi:SAM-dependent methyltransferase
MSFDPAAFREGQRQMWSSGDWPTIATTIQPVADRLVERVDVGSGQDVLDVGAGDGNVAIRAAERGANVTATDITPELFDSGRRRAAAAEVEIDWVEGDAADMPFDDASFDTVLSTFGCIFAPRHQDAADELVRVTRPGGTIGVCAWTPEGLNGQMFALMASAMPAPPPEIEPPVLWGSEEHVSELFAGKGVELEFERELASWDAPSADAWVTTLEENVGPLITAKSVLEPAGEWESQRARLVELFERFNTSDDGFRPEAEYLRILGRRTS